MARCNILFWRDIPSMVEAREGRQSHKVQLSDRFQELIDMVAMRSGLAGTDQYLAEWRREPVGERDADARTAAETLASETEERYAEIRARALDSLAT